MLTQVTAVVFRFRQYRRLLKGREAAALRRRHGRAPQGGRTVLSARPFQWSVTA